MVRKNTPARSRTKSVRDLVKGRAFTLLGLLRFKLPRVVRVRARNESHVVTIILAPADQADAEPAGRAGRWLSTAETLIVDRVREAKRTSPREKVTQATISARAGLPLDPAFKAIVRNLVDRQILTYDDAAGYDLTPGA